jgi:circadian clock protein KaiC
MRRNKLLKTGIPGLDEILRGGLPPHRLYVIEGVPGTGKTTLALQFLLEARRLGEASLYITLSETKEELLEVAESHEWSLDGVHLYELSENEARLKPEQGYTIFHPEEVELSGIAKNVCDVVAQTNPTRVVLDSLSELRLLARDPLRYRRQILSFKQFFIGRKCTVLLIDDTVGRSPDLQMQSICHGVISMERHEREYGGVRRRLSVVKVRGTKYTTGYHDYVIETGGIQVFPRLIAAQHRRSHVPFTISSGLSELDVLLGGGLSSATSTLITGPSGSGKSCLAGCYLYAAAEAGQHATAFIFEESRQTFLDRMAGIGMDLSGHVNKETVTVHRIDPAELSPGEFAAKVREEAEHKHAKVVVIDSLDSYFNAVPNERFLLVHMHEILSYLAEYDVVSILTSNEVGTQGPSHSTTDASYLADTLILLRYFEYDGAVKKAISVIKHRKRPHEQTIRDFQITSRGIHIGQALDGFRGVLSGNPQYVGPPGKLVDVEKKQA